MRAANKPHVCFVAPNAYPLLAGDYAEEILGGAELQQVTLARELAARDYRVSMICLDFGQEDGAEIDGIVVRKSYRLQSGIPILRFIYPRLARIWSALKRTNADIYYTRTASMIVGVVAAYGKFYDKKTIFSAADNHDFSGNTSRIRLRRDRWIFNYGVRNSSRLVAQNEEQKELCNRNFGREAIVIPNCYSTADRESLVTRATVLWVSTIRSVKRPERLIEVAQKLPNREFVMIGGPDRYESKLFDEIKETAEELDNLTFVGFVPYSRIDAYFDEARVVINTSDSEGFPNTFLQSWARAIPTVSYIDSGARSGGRRIGYQVDSVNGMVAQIERLFTDDEVYSLVGQLSEQYCRANHSPASVVDKYGRLFDDLLDR